MTPRTLNLLAAGLTACSAALCARGCAESVPPVPHSTAQYSRLEQSNANAFTTRTIVLANVARTLDPDLPFEERTASRDLLLDPRLKDSEGTAQRELPPTLLARAMNTRVPMEERTNSLMLLKPFRLAPSELRRLEEAGTGEGASPAFRTLASALLAEAGRNPLPAPRPTPPGPKPTPPKPTPPGPKPTPPKPTPPGPKPTPPKPTPPTVEGIATFVRRSARDRSASFEEEKQYRRQLQEMTAKPWDASLLDLINTPAFLARGSALELLNRRFKPEQLGAMLGKVADPKTDAMAALCVFYRRLGYIPADGTEFLSTTLLYKIRKDMIRHAEKYAGKWGSDYQYAFNVRDFHLLTRLALDPLQEELRRTELMLRLGKALLQRPHVAAHSGPNGERVQDAFSQQVGKLGMPDLWNLWLLNGMLEREQMQRALCVTAASDRRDRRHAWGGLVFYANGRAEARLYPSALPLGGRADDLLYVPANLEARYAYDALCRFHCHFENVANIKRAGPTAEELRQAKEDNVYGLVFTSISKDVFCAHYYSPKGVVVSMGMLPFRP